MKIQRPFKGLVHTSRNALIVAASVLLAACSSTGNDVRDGLPNSSGSGQDLASSVEKVLTPNPVGEVIGNGNVRVALLVPSTIPGGAAAVAKELRNGAALAVRDFGQSNIQLVVKDTKGQAAVAQTAAAQAATEGASLIVGPLFAANVSAASGSAQPAGIPILAFSTDTSVARRGVYLFSYTPQADTQRIVTYASSIGRRSIAAFLPRNPEGDLRERLVREIGGRNGMIVNIVRYDRTPQGIEKVVAEAASTAISSDSIYLPEGGPIPNLIVSGLKRNGVNLGEKQLLGSGAWESVKLSDPVLNGAIYPGRDISSFNQFASRYKATYGAQPGVQGALAYDALTLASELARTSRGRAPYSQSRLETRSGFQGVSGAFRIKADGTTQRGLAIYKVTGGKGGLLEPAVSSFVGG